MSATRAKRTDEWIGCPCSGETLDKFIQPAVLATLAGGPMHGYGLAERIGACPPSPASGPTYRGFTAI